MEVPNPIIMPGRISSPEGIHYSDRDSLTLGPPRHSTSLKSDLNIGIRRPEFTRLRTNYHAQGSAIRALSRNLSMWYHGPSLSKSV